MKGTLFAIAFASLACGASTLPPTGQLVVHVGTDAPLPAAPGSPAPAITPLFDRIRISVYAPSATAPCAGCVGEFGIDSDQEAAGKISFGAVLETGVAGYVARIDMFRAVATQLGNPLPRSTVTTFIALPTITGDGIVPIGAFLSVDSVGVVQGSLSKPMPPTMGEPEYDKVNTWPGALKVSCVGTAKPQEVCVPGGAYWMGNPMNTDERSNDPDNDPHLVVMSPFFVDTTEVTVATFRASNLATIDSMTMLSTDPIDDDKNFLYDGCSYTTMPGAYEAYSLNCVSWTMARQYCQAAGKDLITEAQFEYVGSGFKSALFVWGDDEPSCSDAVWGRGGFGYFAQSGNSCNLNGRSYGPLPPGSGQLDQLVLPGGTIFDLTGNVSEWTVDKWNRTTEPCWAAPILRDPMCATVSLADGDLQSIRGGAWPTTVGEIEAAQRNPHLGDARPQTGIRCARAAK